MEQEEQQSSDRKSQEPKEQRMKEQKEELRKILEETRARVDESFEELRARTGGTDAVERWIRKNPLLSTLAAAGVGLVVGRSISALRNRRFGSADSLAERIEVRAEEIARRREKEGRKTAEDRVREARDRARAAAQEVRTEGARKFSETKDAVSGKLSDAVSKAALAFVAKKAGDWVKDQKK